jgi:hypothetical protein
MQKLINLLALTSFGVSACVVGAGIYVYQNREALVEAAVTAATEAAMLEIPDALGADAIPAPTGGAPVPQFRLPI